MKTGFKALDEIITLDKNKLILVAGKAGVGKTTFAVKLLNNIAIQNVSSPVKGKRTRMAVDESFGCKMDDVGFQDLVKRHGHIDLWRKFLNAPHKILRIYVRYAKTRDIQLLR